MAKITIESVCKVPDAGLASNRKHSHGLCLPEVGTRPVAKKLAVVGGGKSIVDHVDELREFDGEIWAINGIYDWCVECGIDATFYAIDPLQMVSTLCTGAKRAVLADICHPDTFKALEGASVELAKIGKDAILHDTTAASTAPMIASARGHQEVTFYGCESSFEGSTHLYKDDAVGKLWIDVDGVEYLTNLYLLPQALFIAKLAEALPDFIKLRCGGILKALVDSGGEYAVTHTTRDIAEQIEGAPC